MSMVVTLHENKRVSVQLADHTIHTDQKKQDGGRGEFPAPFEYFLASMATCAGIYIQGFCESRSLDYSNIKIHQKVIYDTVRQRIGKVRQEIHVPEGFPEKYRSALVKAAELCAVKKFIENPPDIEAITI